MAKPWYKFWGKDEAPVIEKAVKVEPMPEPKAKFFDPVYAGSEYMGEVPTEHHPGTAGLSYETLHNMARTPVIASILNTRIQQVAEFAAVQTSPYGIGFRVRLRDMRQKATKASEKKAAEIQHTLLRAGGEYGVGGFEPFLRSVMRDSLMYDQCNFEILKNRGGKVIGFVPVDAATMRRARPTKAELEAGRYSQSTARYVQVIDHKISHEFKADEMAWGVRRPRTWIHSQGYGFPELEELTRIVTYILNAETYNAVNFTNGIHASTILALKASLSQEQFRVFKRELTAMMHGPANAKRMPMVLLDPRADARQELQAVNLSQSNREMEYTQWNSYLIKIACSIYSMDPAELGFVFGNENQVSTITANGPSDRITASKERGLRPMLRALESWLNNWVIHPIDEDFSIDFVGFDAKSEEQKQQLDIAALKAYKTLNEVRAEHDLPPLDDEVGNLILEPSFLQVYMQTMMAQDEGGMPGGEEGMPGGEGGNFDDEADDLYNQAMALMNEGQPEEAAEKAFNALLAAGPGTVESATENLAKAVERGADQGYLSKEGAHKGKWVPMTDENNNVKAVMVEV
jgi:hypothetical protein